jgi:hypothetical protein
MSKSRWDGGVGERNRHAKISIDDVIAIRAASGTSSEIGKKYGISSTVVSQIRHRILWKSVPLSSTDKIYDGGWSGEVNGMSKLTTENVRLIRKSLDSGSVLATRFGVSQATISRVKHGALWRHVRGD